MDGLSGCAALQTLTLEGLKSLASVDGLSGCAALQTVTLLGLDSLASVDGLSGCAALQTVELKNLSSLASLDGLAGCTALQSLEFKESRWAPMYKLASMPDLSSLVDLEVKGLPSQLQAWEDGGRKAFPRVE